MVTSGCSIDDTFQFLPLPLNEGFFRRLGAAWRAFWNPDQETYTKDQVGQEVLRQNKEMLAQLQTMQEMLKKKGIDDADIRKMFERMNKHYAGVVGSVIDTLDHGPDVDRAMAARSGGTETAVAMLPADPGGAWDALQSIPPTQRSDALDNWWSILPDPDKVNIHALLDLKYPVKDVQGKLLRKPLEDARAAGKI